MWYLITVGGIIIVGSTPLLLPTPFHRHPSYICPRSASTSNYSGSWKRGRLTPASWPTSSHHSRGGRGAGLVGMLWMARANIFRFARVVFQAPYISIPGAYLFYLFYISNSGYLVLFDPNGRTNPENRPSTAHFSAVSCSSKP